MELPVRHPLQRRWDSSIAYQIQKQVLHPKHGSLIDTLNPANLAVLGIGNHSLSGVAASDNGLMEYRIQLYTEEVQDWVIPNLDAFAGVQKRLRFPSNPSAIQPNAPQITFSTHHAAMEQELLQPAVFEFAMIKATTEGSSIPTPFGQQFVFLRWSSPIVSDTDNLLDSSSVSVSVRQMVFGCRLGTLIQRHGYR